MLSLNNVKPTIGSRKTSKRLGRGNGSGKGTTAGRGMNGQNSRSGGGVAPWFEGGQTPLFRRMPKLKGFSNSKFKKEYNIVNLSDLENLASKGITEINKEVLLQNKIIRKKSLEIKLLGKGELKSKLTVVVDKASASAREAVEKAGGKIELK
ncbi:50S ribosomal protein L15 [Candidatus Gracilibacteria bacterium]|nr:MAG: 50S ribosomal protein L15 [Candidatus Gracilibacteria bacterium]